MAAAKSSDSDEKLAESSGSSVDAPPPAEKKRIRKEQVEVLRTGQRVRIRQARAALQEQAGLSSREMDEIDAITREMNAALAGPIEDMLATRGKPSPLQMLDLATKVSAILYEGQADLEKLVGPSIAQVDDSAREIFSYIEVPDALLELEGLADEVSSADPSEGDSEPPGGPPRP